MKRILTKDDMIDELAQKTGFYKKNMKDVMDAFEEIIIENMKMARVGEDSEMFLAHGVYLRGVRKPEGEAIDPRDRSIIISPSKVNPRAYFSQHFRDKLYVNGRGYEKKRRNRIYNANKKNKKNQEGEDAQT